MTTSTTGADVDPDGYAVAVDAGTAQAIADNATVTISQLSSGSHQVTLSGVAGNCTVAGQDPRTISVTAGTTASTTFAMTCTALGAIKIITSTTGMNLDPDGYTISVDAGAPQTIAINDSLTVSQLNAGTHQVALSGVAGNCAVTGQNPRTVAVVLGTTTTTTFAVTCTAPGAIDVITSTTGVNPDSDGYSILVDSVATHPIGTNDTLTISPLNPGDHQMILTGVAGNCLLSGPATHIVTVTSGATTPTTFAVTCYPPPLTAGTIVFSGKRNGNYDLYTMNADGTGLTNLINNATGAEAGPQWSPNGSKIVFYSDTSGQDVIYVMNANGTGVTRITNDTTTDFEPTWSPDSSKIAFTDYTNRHIVVINSDGSNRTQITSGSFEDYGPAWSPDGSKIAFTTNRDGNFEIYVMNADGSNPVRLTNLGGDDIAPDWSPDGSNIVFQSNFNIGPYEISVMHADGSGLTFLTSNAADDINPTWSPDGSAIVFSTNRVDGTRYAIFVMNANGTSPMQLTPLIAGDQVDNEPDWKP